MNDTNKTAAENTQLDLSTDCNFVCHTADVNKGIYKRVGIVIGFHSFQFTISKINGYTQAKKDDAMFNRLDCRECIKHL